MRKIELYGTVSAVCGDYAHQTSAKKGPIGPLCRYMISVGHSPDDLCEVYRSDTLVFHAAPLSHYADHDVTESDSTGLQRKKHVPFDKF